MHIIVEMYTYQADNVYSVIVDVHVKPICELEFI